MASSHNLFAPSSLLLILFLFSGGVAPLQARAQQPNCYQIANCPNQHKVSGLLDYFCTNAPSCPAYLTFSVGLPYADLASIAALIGANASSLAAANSVGVGTALTPGTKVLVPTTCSCTAATGGRFYQRGRRGAAPLPARGTSPVNRRRGGAVATPLSARRARAEGEEREHRTSLAHAGEEMPSKEATVEMPRGKGEMQSR